MQKTSLKLFLAAVLLLASQACVPAGPPPTLDLHAIDTAVAGTAAAAATQTAQVEIPQTGLNSPTPTVRASPTTFPTFTAVVLGSWVTVSRDTNCREGPGQVYPRVMVLRAGESAAVVGRGASGNYWIIRNPDRPDQTCWLPGDNVSVAGVAGAAPVFTPPPTPRPTRTPKPPPTATRTLAPTFTPITPTLTPTPTLSSTPSLTSTPAPTFIISSIGMDGCGGTIWWVDVQLQNAGPIAFESIDMIVRDTTTPTDLLLSSDDFTNRDGCGGSTTQDNLPPGVAHIVSSPDLTTDPMGHVLHITIKLCTNPGQAGTCETQTVDFTP
jgi:hypothetical protein